MVRFGKKNKDEKLTLEILKVTAKLSEVEFLGVLRILGISPVKKENDKIEAKNFEEVFLELEKKVGGLSLTKKKNLLKLLTLTACGRNFTGNQTSGAQLEEQPNATESKN